MKCVVNEQGKGRDKVSAQEEESCGTGPLTHDVERSGVCEVGLEPQKLGV